MASDITLALDDDALKMGMISLECDGFWDATAGDMELMMRENDTSDLMIMVCKGTGRPLLIQLDRFKEKTEKAVKMLMEYPLPWTFRLAVLGIKEKPLEDVIMAVWKKYKSV